MAMLETISKQCICKFQEKRECIEKWKGSICPRIKQKVEKIRMQTMNYEATLARSGVWEVGS